MDIKHIGLFFRILDRLMWPIMFIVGGCRENSVQHTHFWHIQNEKSLPIDKSKAINVVGSDTSFIKSKRILFHIPILGGWKDYVVLEVVNNNKHWHIAWQGKSDDIQIHRLPIYDRTIRVLSGHKGTVTTFFAVSDSGRQIPLSLVGEGRLGDMSEYSDIQLY